MRNKPAVIFDLDLTLVDHQGTLLPGALQLLRVLHAEGVSFGIATHGVSSRVMEGGRYPYLMQMLQTLEEQGIVDVPVAETLDLVQKHGLPTEDEFEGKREEIHRKYGDADPFLYLLHCYGKGAALQEGSRNHLSLFEVLKERGLPLDEAETIAMVGDQPSDIHFLDHISGHYGGAKQMVKMLSVNEVFPVHYRMDDPDCAHVVNIGQMATVLADHAILSHDAASQVCRACDEEKAFLSSVVQSNVTPAGLARSASFPSLDELAEQVQELEEPATPPRPSTPLRIVARHPSSSQREEEGCRPGTPDTPPWNGLLVQNNRGEAVAQENREREQNAPVIHAPRPIRPTPVRPSRGIDMNVLLNRGEEDEQQTWQDYEDGRRTPEPFQRPASPFPR